MYTTQRSYFGMGSQLTQGVKNLLIANGIVFVLFWMIGDQNPIFYYLALIPKLTWTKFFIWQLVTYMFLHGGFLHILLNMYALWMFGSEVERMWGTKAFYKYYFITGIGAGIIHTLITPNSMIPTLGASGAVMGVLTAYAMMFPNRRITMLLFFILPITMRARTLALLFAGISLLNGMAGSPDGIAHFAHLGGMVVGYLYIKQDWRFSAFFGKMKTWFRNRRMRVVQNEEEDLDRLRHLVDSVLDKANTVGMENLTRDEKILLKRASKIFKKRNNQ